MGKTRKRNQLNPKTIKHKKKLRKRGSTKKSKAQQRQRKTRKVFGGAKMNDPLYSSCKTIIKKWLNKLGLELGDEGTNLIQSVVDRINESTIKDMIVSTFDTICQISYIVYKVGKDNESKNPEEKRSLFRFYIIGTIDAYELKKNWEDCAIEEEGFQTPIYEDFIKKTLPENFIDGYHDKGSYDDGLDIRVSWPTLGHSYYDIWTIVQSMSSPTTGHSYDDIWTIVNSMSSSSIATHMDKLNNGDIDFSENKFKEAAEKYTESLESFFERLKNKELNELMIVMKLKRKTLEGDIKDQRRLHKIYGIKKGSSLNQYEEMKENSINMTEMWNENNKDCKYFVPSFFGPITIQQSDSPPRPHIVPQKSEYSTYEYINKLKKKYSDKYASNSDIMLYFSLFVKLILITTLAQLDYNTYQEQKQKPFITTLNQIYKYTKGMRKTMTLKHYGCKDNEAYKLPIGLNVYEHLRDKRKTFKRTEEDISKCRKDKRDIIQAMIEVLGYTNMNNKYSKKTIEKVQNNLQRYERNHSNYGSKFRWGRVVQQTYNNIHTNLRKLISKDFARDFARDMKYVEDMKQKCFEEHIGNAYNEHGSENLSDPGYQTCVEEEIKKYEHYNRLKKTLKSENNEPQHNEPQNNDVVLPNNTKLLMLYERQLLNGEYPTTSADRMKIADEIINALNKSSEKLPLDKLIRQVEAKVEEHNKALKDNN